MALRTRSGRRTTDRMEDVAAWVLVAAGLLVVLFGYGLGKQSYEQGLERARAESAERTPTTARLVADAQVTSSANATSSTVLAPATWRDRFGAAHDGFVVVPRGLHAGAGMPIWTDGSGAKVPAPMTNQDALLLGLCVGGMALAGGIGLLFGVWALVRRATMAANCAHWADEWRDVSPNWTDSTRDGEA